jgi:DNA topoisomerase-3
MNYVCEHAVGPGRKCDFRTGKIILQQEISPDQIRKLLTGGKTDLLEKFISKKTGRAFKAFLSLGKEGKVGFEFEKREPRAKGEKTKREPPAKVDFTGQQPIGACPICGGNVFESETQYLCEKTQAEKKACKFKSGKKILQQEVNREQMEKLLKSGKTDLLSGFISKRGTAFPAFLVLDENKKVSFEFPPRGEPETR